MKRLVIIQTVAPDYRKLFFEKLKSSLKNRFELYAGEKGFETSIQTNSDIHLPAKNFFLLNRRFLFQTGIWHLLLKDDILVLEMNPRILSNWIFLIIRRILGKKTILWGHAWPRKGKNSKTDFIRNLMRKLASQIIVYTNRQKRELQAKMPGKKIVAAPNTIYSVEQMKTGPKINPKNLIYVGRLVTSKKVFFMVQAFHQSLRFLPDNANLVIVGDGPEKEKIQKYIERNNLHNRIKLLGHISDYNQLKTLYDEALFSISPGYVGLSIIQSFSFGVPMLISKNENHSPEIEAARENDNAIFFETDNLEDFADKLQLIYKTKAEWIKKREKIVSFCKENYSVEAMAKVFIDSLE